MRTIGLDVHKHFAEVAIIEPGRGLRRGDRISTAPDALRAFVQTLGAQDQVVLESSSNTWAVAELLGAHAGRVVVSNPLRTRAIADAKCKTDQIDAAVLAQLLAADFIPEVWMPDAPTRALRRRVAHRASLVQQRTRLRNRIQAVLQRNLISAPYSDAFGPSGMRWLRAVELPAEERARVDSALRLLDALAAEVAAVDHELVELALADARVRHLITIPGVGPVSALAIVAVVGDVRRFGRPNQLVSYLGLDPRVRQSGDHPAYTGHISRQGQAHARGLLIEAALGAVRVPGPLRAFFRRVCGRRGEQVATVAVARKLVILSWHLLTGDEDYRWQSTTLTEDKVRRAQLAAGWPANRAGRAMPPTASAAASDASSSDGSSSRPKRHTAHRSLPGVHERTRSPPKGKRLSGPRRGKVRGGAFVPSAPLFPRGRPRPRKEDTPRGLDVFIRTSVARPHASAYGRRPRPR